MRSWPWLTRWLTLKRRRSLRRRAVAARTAACKKDCSSGALHGTYRAYGANDPQLKSPEGRTLYNECVRLCLDPLPGIFVQKPIIEARRQPGSEMKKADCLGLPRQGRAEAELARREHASGQSQAIVRLAVAADRGVIRYRAAASYDTGAPLRLERIEPGQRIGSFATGVDRPCKLRIKIDGLRSSLIVAPPCSLRASSGGGPLAEQGVAPGFCADATQDPGSSRITARAVARRGCLRWLDVDRMNGGAGLARLDRGEVKARPSGFPEERPERRNATGGAPQWRACRSNGTLAPQGAQATSAVGAPPPQGAE